MSRFNRSTPLPWWQRGATPEREGECGGEHKEVMGMGKLTMDQYAEVWGQLKSWPSKRLVQIRDRLTEELERREKVAAAKQEALPIGQG